MKTNKLYFIIPIIGLSLTLTGCYNNKIDNAAIPKETTTKSHKLTKEQLIYQSAYKIFHNTYQIMNINKALNNLAIKQKANLKSNNTYNNFKSNMQKLSDLYEKQYWTDPSQYWADSSHPYFKAEGNDRFYEYRDNYQLVSKDYPIQYARQNILCTKYDKKLLQTLHINNKTTNKLDNLSSNTKTNLSLYEKYYKLK